MIDTMHDNGGPRVRLAESSANLDSMLAQAAERDWSVLMLAPPIADAEHNARTAALDERFTRICAASDVPYLRVHQPLCDNVLWTAEVCEGDGAHPGAAGYDEITALIAPYRREWLSY
ncbi:GDSL-type esterase/lipase family protein [Nocardia sp. 004]|uniref:GDSL-type esterase/lipase family protein n=1 Tax=Nocardia sp. 004 TaxID=3385978 RepID=UPI0039A2219C